MEYWTSLFSIRIKEIAEKTGTLVESICSLPDFNFTPNDFLPKPQQPIPQELRCFADYVVLLEQASNWGKKEGYPDPFTATTLPLFQVLDVRKVARHDLDGYGSWLYRGDTVGTCSVVFDPKAISELARANGKDPNAIYFRLFVHELGHFVLHRKDLLNGVGLGVMANSAEPQFEAEAWLFAGLFAGLCVGHSSYLAKNAGAPDQSFLIL